MLHFSDFFGEKKEIMFNNSATKNYIYLHPSLVKISYEVIIVNENLSSTDPADKIKINNLTSWIKAHLTQIFFLKHIQNTMELKTLKLIEVLFLVSFPIFNFRKQTYSFQALRFVPAFLHGLNG